MPSETHNRVLAQLRACVDAAIADESRQRDLVVSALSREVFLRFLHAAGASAEGETGLPGLVDPHPDGGPHPLRGAALAPLLAMLDAARLSPAPVSHPGDADLDPGVLADAYERLRPGRHNDGVFYTPPGEVRFMCREALCASLSAAMGWPDDFPALLHLLYEDSPPALACEDAARLYRAVADLRVCDPAAGCGALLIGMAVEMTRLLRVLASLLPGEMRVDSAPHPGDACRHVATCCLFGVDLDAAAIQVTRRRLALFALASPGTALPETARMLLSHLRAGDGLLPPPSEGPRHPAAVDWRADFPDAFSRTNPGFDIVITNPPYVRQELLGAEVKARVGHACAKMLPVTHSLDGKSDLYAHFYHLALGLLRIGGALSAITSNSWLDVEFGAALQALLLQHSRILSLVESARVGTFAEARINPVVGLFRRVASVPEGQTRFVRLGRPLGGNWSAADVARFAGAPTRLSLPAYRVIPVAQRTLSDEVLRDRPRSGNWGGRFLRAPDLFHELLEQCGSRLCRLDSLAAVRFGIKTGNNAFFYLEEVAGETAGGDCRLCRNGMGYVFPIEARFLRPVLLSPREVTGPELRESMLRRWLFTCREPCEALAGTAAGRYIEWGEQEMRVPLRASIRGRALWYAVPMVPSPPVLHPLIAYERACVALNPDGAACDANLVGIYPYREGDAVPIAAFLASAPGVLAREVAGIANLGQGALKLNPAYLGRLLLPDPRRVEQGALARVREAFDVVRQRAFPSVVRGEPDAAWRGLDEAVLAMLGPGAPDADRLRAATRAMVHARLTRAGATLCPG